MNLAKPELAPTIMVTGASGLLGGNLLLSAEQRPERLIGVYHHHPVHLSGVTLVGADLTDPDQLDRLVQEFRPTWVIHGAALTNVDYCEAHPEAAMIVNALVPWRLARAARRQGAGLVYISTDAVFDGSRGDYIEEDVAAPLNHYGRSKLAGELAVRQEMPSALIVRTNIYGWNILPKQSLAEWILANLEAGRTITGFTDVIFSPILVNDLSHILFAMMDWGLHGLFHVAGRDSLSKFSFALKVAEVFDLDPGLVRPGLSGQSPLVAKRAQKNSLNPHRVEQILGMDMPGVDDGLRRFRHFRDSGFLAGFKGLAGGRKYA